MLERMISALLPLHMQPDIWAKYRWVLNLTAVLIPIS